MTLPTPLSISQGEKVFDIKITRQPWLTPDNPNYSCPACGASYRFTHPHRTMRWMCPDCGTWLCWQDVEIVEVRRQGAPLCPRCGQTLVNRTNGKTGRSFWGCLDWRVCKGSRPSGSFSVSTVSVEAGGRVAMWREFVPGEVTIEWERTDRMRDRLEAREKTFGEWLTKRRG